MSEQPSPIVDLVVAGPAMVDAELVVVGVHGRDQAPAYLVDHLVDPIGDPVITWLLPAADGPRWWPASFMDARSANEPHMSAAIARIEAVTDRLDGIEPSKVVWFGFSQGACLVSEVVARSGRPWGGLIALSGGRVGPPGADLAVGGDLAAMPVHLSCGARDRWVPLERMQETAGAFEAAGAAVTVSVFDDAEHCIRPAELDAVASLLDGAKRRNATMR